MYLGCASLHTSCNLPDECSGEKKRAAFYPLQSRSPYLVLHDAGFAMPLYSHTKRCAFTAPFHPFHTNVVVYFLLHFPSSHSY